MAPKGYTTFAEDSVGVSLEVAEPGKKFSWKWAVITASALLLLTGAALLSTGTGEASPNDVEDWPRYMKKGGWRCHGDRSCTQGTNAQFKKGTRLDVIKNKRTPWVAQGCIHPDDWLGRSVYIVSQKEGWGGGMKLGVHNDCRYINWITPATGQTCNGRDSGCTNMVEGDGDCDYNWHCRGALKCGRDNCRAPFGRATSPYGGYDRTDDCCYSTTTRSSPGVCMHINEGSWEWWTIEKKGHNYIFVSGRWPYHYHLDVANGFVQQTTSYNKDRNQFALIPCEDAPAGKCTNGEWTVGLYNVAAKKFIKVDDKTPNSGKRSIVAGVTLSDEMEAMEQFKIVTVSSKSNGGFIVSPRCRSKAAGGRLVFPLRRNPKNSGICTIKAVCTGSGGKCSETNGKFLLSNFGQSKTFHFGATAASYKWLLTEKKGVNFLQSHNGNLGSVMHKTYYLHGRTYLLAATFPCNDGVWSIKTLYKNQVKRYDAGKEIYRIDTATQAKPLRYLGATGYWWSCSKCTAGKTHFGCSGLQPFGSGKVYAVAKKSDVWTNAGQYLLSNTVERGYAKWSYKPDRSRAWKLYSDYQTGLTDIRRRCTAWDCRRERRQWLHSNAGEGGTFSFGSRITAYRPRWKRRYECAGGGTGLLASVGNPNRNTYGRECARACLRYARGHRAGTCCQYAKYASGAARCMVFNAPVRYWNDRRRHRIWSFKMDLYNWEVACEQPKFEGVCTIQANCVTGNPDFEETTGDCRRPTDGSHGHYSNSGANLATCKTQCLADSRCDAFDMPGCYKFDDGWKGRHTGNGNGGGNKCYVKSQCKRHGYKYWSSNMHSARYTSWGGYNSDAGKTSAHGYTYSWALHTKWVGGIAVTTIRSHCTAGTNGCPGTNGKYLQSNMRNGGAAVWSSRPNTNYAWVLEEGSNGVVFIKQHCKGGGCPATAQYLRSDSKEGKPMSVGEKASDGRYAWKVHCTNG